MSFIRRSELLSGLEEGDLIVVKGSRAMRMGRVVRSLLEGFGEAG